MIRVSFPFHFAHFSARQPSPLSQTTVTMDGDRWICPSCTTRNKDTKLRCGICMRSRPQALRTKKAASNKSSSAAGPPNGSNAGGAGGRSAGASADVVDLTASPHPTSGAGGSSGRRPSTESARSKKRRREREQVQGSGIGSSSVLSSSSSASSSASPATLVDNGVSVISRKEKGMEAASSSSNASGGRSSNDDLPRQRQDVSKKPKNDGSSGSSSTGGKRSTASMQQSTLFGKIVTGIREKDASTLPTTSREFDKPSNDATIAKKNQQEEVDANGSVTSAPASTNRRSSSSSTGTGNVFVEGRYQALKTKADRVMKETFGISSLRNLQPQAVDGALRGQSQIVVMATGGGKSLCYQLPAAVLPGVTVVVSPLIALMQDQVQALNAKGIPAALYSSANGQRENTEVLQRLVGKSSSKKGDKKKKTKGTDGSDADQPAPKPLKLIYCTPELIETDKFRAVLTDLYKRRELALFAVDEAHCLSSWGHDFRPAFLKLTWVRQSFRDVPITACTATATHRVISDLRSILDLPEKTVPCHMGSFNRQNITYEVRYKDNIDSTNPRGAMGDLTSVIKNEHETAKAAGVPASGIVYVHKRADASMLAQRICRESGVVARPYHAGLKDSERKSIQTQWTSGAVQVVW